MEERLTPHDLPAEGSVLIGVSGGADSLCLLHLVASVPNLGLIVAHFDHRLRRGSDREARFVGSVARKLKLPFVSGEGDVAAYAAEQKLSMEESARTLRYRFLFAQARAAGASAVAVGHTADDQVETILMHFLRGAGLAGLKGMRGQTLLPEFDPTIALVRPILHLWRHETETYCREHALLPVQDPTNADETYFRNSLRHNLIPELEKYNPRFKETLLRTAAALAGDHETLSEVVEAAWLKVLVKAEADQVTLRASSLETMPHGLRRNILRKAMESLRPSLRNLDFDTLERAANFIRAGDHTSKNAGGTRHTDLTEGLHLYQEGDAILLAGLEADMPNSHWPLTSGVREVLINGRVNLNEHFSLSAVEVEVESARACASENGDSFTAWLDAGLAVGQLTVRTRRSGDGFSPLGMDGKTVKLQDFYINVKLPRRARAGWPLVCAGEQIVWVPGFRLAHPFRVTDKTQRVLKLVISPIE